MFTDPRFARDGRQARAHLRAVGRRSTTPTSVRSSTRWMRLARAAGRRSRWSASATRGSTGARCRSPSRFKRMFRRFRARYPWVRDVRDVERGQPLRRAPCHRPRARRALLDARSQRACRRCRIAAAELLDSASMVSYARAPAARTPGASRGTGRCTTTSRPTASRPSGLRRLLRIDQGPDVADRGRRHRRPPQPKTRADGSAPSPSRSVARRSA